MYIVTGGAGFIGSAVVWRLNQAGIDRILVVDNLASTEKWRNLLNLRFADYMHRDEFLDRVERRALPESVKGIIHMGACSDTTERNADFLMRNNLHYSQKVCHYAMFRGARFINASSAATYGDGSRGFSDKVELLDTLKPLNMYGYSKFLFDRWAHSEGLLGHLASLKFFNVYGPNEYHKGAMRSMVVKAYEQILEKGEVALFSSDRPEYQDGGQLRDFVYIKDCVELIWYLLNNPKQNGVFNVGAGEARSWNDLMLAVFAAMEREPRIRYVPMPEELKGRYQYYTQADMGWLETSSCPYRPQSLEAGVQDYVRNYLAAADPYL